MWPAATSCWSATEESTPPDSNTATSSSAAADGRHDDSPAGSAEAAVTGAGDAAGAAAAASSCSLIVRSMLSTPLRRPAASVVCSPLASARPRLLSAASAAGGAPWSPRASSATMPRATRESAVPPTRSAPSARCARTWTTEVQPRTRVPSASRSAAAPPSGGGSRSPSRSSRSVRSRSVGAARSTAERRRKLRGSASSGVAESATGGVREMEWYGVAI